MNGCRRNSRRYASRSVGASPQSQYSTNRTAGVVVADGAIRLSDRGRSRTGCGATVGIRRMVKQNHVRRCTRRHLKGSYIVAPVVLMAATENQHTVPQRIVRRAVGVISERLAIRHEPVAVTRVRGIKIVRKTVGIYERIGVFRT